MTPLRHLIHPTLVNTGLMAALVVAPLLRSTPSLEAGRLTPPVAPAAQRAALPMDAAFDYSITDLGLWFPYAVNNQRQVVGSGLYGGAPDLANSALLWQNGQVYVVGKFGWPAARFTDINDNGQVSGYAGDGAGNYRSFRWTDASGDRQVNPGELEWLGDLGGGKTTAHSISLSGTVAGTSWNLADANRAVTWNGGPLTALAGNDTAAYAINSSGVVVGSYCPNDPECGDVPPEKAVVWAGGPPSALTLDGHISRAAAINEVGEVTGQYTAFDGDQSRAFLWLPQPAYGLGAGFHVLDFQSFGYPYGGINNAGQVVGNQALWQNGAATPLNDLLPADSGWSLTHATDINDHGDIVGVGYLNGQQRGFLLSPPPRWTLLFYLAADNDLAGSYPALFQQLEAAAGLPGARLLVLWDSNGSGDSAYFEVQYDADLSQYAAYEEGVTRWAQGELNTGSSVTLSDFIQWGVTHSPTEHYALILDDHGSGLGGLAWDDTDDRDFITLPELRLALSTAQDQTSQQLDVLYMAMCLMGMLEDAYQVRGLARYYVASVDLQTTYTNYLSGFDARHSPAQAAQALAGAYAAEMAARTGNRARAYTISVADLAQLDPLVTATNALGAALATEMEVISPTLTTIAALVQRYDNQPPRGHTLADTYIDLHDFAGAVAANLGSEAAIVAQATAVQQAIEAYILYEAHGSVPSKNVDHSRGVSIFFPATASSFYHAGNYDFAVGADWGGGLAARASTADATTWGGFLVHYFQATQPAGPDDPWPPPLVAKDWPVSLLYLPLLRR